MLPDQKENTCACNQHEVCTVCTLRNVEENHCDLVVSQPTIANLFEKQGLGYAWIMAYGWIATKMMK